MGSIISKNFFKKYLFKNEKVELAKFKKLTKYYRSQYELLELEDLKLIRSRLEVNIEVNKNDSNMPQIISQYLAAITLMLVTLLPQFFVILNNASDTSLKVIDVHLAEYQTTYEKYPFLANTTDLINQIYRKYSF